MINEVTIRQLLIDSCHSSDAADGFFRSRFNDEELLSLLVKIAREADDCQGDAPMQAAYWKSQYSANLLMSYEPALMEMLPMVDGYEGHVALALGKTRSPRGRALIAQELEKGERFDAWLFREALAAADQEG